MMQTELLQASWPFYEIVNSAFDHVEQYGLNMENHMGGCNQFPSMFIPKEEAISEGSTISFNSNLQYLSHYSLDYHPPHLPSLEEDFSMELEEFEPVFSDVINGAYHHHLKDLRESEESFPSAQLSNQGEEGCRSPSSSMISDHSCVSSVRSSLVLPKEDMEIDNHLSFLHLLEAYGEAVEKQQKELAEVILRCISQKGSPLGETLERVSFNLSQGIDSEGDYLRQEAIKNFKDAFKVFYQIFPHGRFAHFTVNAAIFESIPDGVELIHLVDFDMGEGVQWPPIIEAIAQRSKMTLKLTSIKWGEDSFFNTPFMCKFDETERQLTEVASSFGIKLIMEESAIEELAAQLKKQKTKAAEKEWLVFNCMVSLPHMGRQRSRRHVSEFLNLANDCLHSSADDAGRISKGMIAFGDGDAYEHQDNCSSFSKYFNGHVLHYQALLESIEFSFPENLAEARTTMENLFVTPYISSLAWSKKWEDMREGCHLLHGGIGLEGRMLSKEMLTELKEMVKQLQSSYGVRVGEENGNEIVLEWKQTPLVRVSIW